MNAPNSPPPLAVVGVGIDTARYGHHATFLRPDLQPAAKALTVSEHADGYQRLQRVLERLHRQHPQARLRVRLDAAGPYAVNLEAFLRDSPLPIGLSVGCPLENRRYREVHFPKRKADPIDSYCLARFAVREEPAPTPPCPPAFRAAREIAGRLNSQTRQSTRLVNQLHNLMARVFPELALVAPDFSAAWVLDLLTAYPTAPRIARARRASLERIAGVSPPKAQALQRHARRTVGSLDGPEAEQLVADLVDQVKRSRQTEARLLDALVDVYRHLPDVGPIHTIPGIGAATAAVLAARIVSIDRFATPERLASYFGVVPEQDTSGVTKQGRAKEGAPMRMSPRGCDLARKHLWNAARSAIQCNPAVQALYERLIAKGTRRSVALGHAMRKLVHLVFAIWKTHTPFDPDHYPWAPKADAASDNNEAAGHTEDTPPDRSVVTAASTPSVPQTPASGNPVDFPELRRRVSMRQVLEHVGWLDRLTGAGPQRRGPCPIHDAMAPRGRAFSVNLTHNLFQCFDAGCAARGNVLDLWAALHRLPLRQAAEHMAGAFGLDDASNIEEEPVVPGPVPSTRGGQP